MLRGAQDRSAIEINSLMHEGHQLRIKFETNWTDDDPEKALAWSEKVTVFLRDTYPQFIEYSNNSAGIFTWRLMVLPLP